MVDRHGIVTPCSGDCVCLCARAQGASRSGPAVSRRVPCGKQPAELGQFRKLRSPDDTDLSPEPHAFPPEWPDRICSKHIRCHSVNVLSFSCNALMVNQR